MENYYQEVYLNNLVLLQLFGYSALFVTTLSIIYHVIKRIFTKPVMICIECGHNIYAKDELPAPYADVYQCPRCGHPHRGLVARWNINTLEPTNWPLNAIEVPPSFGKLIKKEQFNFCHGDQTLFTFKHGYTMIQWDATDCWTPINQSKKEFTSVQDLHRLLQDKVENTYAMEEAYYNQKTLTERTKDLL